MAFLGLEVSKLEWRDAARLAVQSAAAAAGTFSIMKAAGMPEKFVGIISAVLVVQPSVGTTLVKGQDRVLATIVGCIIGVLCLIAMPDGWGTAGALAISMLIMNGIAGLKSNWRYGVVAAIALALGSETNVMQDAQDRALSIGLGVVVGLACALVLWPERSKTRARRDIRAALEALAGYCRSTMSRAADGDGSGRDSSRAQYQAKVSAAGRSVKGVRLASDEPLRKALNAAGRLYHAVAVLDRLSDRTREMTEGRERVREQIRAIREHSCEAAEQIAAGDPDQSDHLDAMQRAIEAVRGALTRRSGYPTESWRPADPARSQEEKDRRALGFALDELEASVQELMRLVRHGAMG